MRLRSLVKFGVVVALVGGIAAAAFLAIGPRRNNQPVSTAAPVPVAAARAVRRDVPQSIHTIGTVRSNDTIAVQSQAYGPILKVEFEPGQEVKQGQELFLIDPRPYQAAVDRAKAQLAHDQAMAGEAQMDLKRYQLLEKENSIVRQQAQDQYYAVQQDQGTVAADQANLETAQINLGYTHIPAPITGRGGILLVEVGNLVGPAANGPAAGFAAERRALALPAATSGEWRGPRQFLCRMR